jgi:predicted DNA-binding mobile mystery protein A
MKISSKTAHLRRRQLDQRLQEEPRNMPPASGWIGAIREALGMSSAQLARRLGITKPTMRKIEESERRGTITLSTLKRAANALGCEVKVSLLPPDSLEGILRRRALETAEKILKRTSLHMNLEAQGTSPSFQKEQMKETADDLIRNRDRRLWED